MLLTIDGRRYFIVQRGIKMNYKALIDALVERITMQQLGNLPIDDTRTIYFYKLIALFSYHGLLDTEYEEKCICHHDIKYNYDICNIETKQHFIIGSTCRYHWEKKYINPEDYHCEFCGIQKTSRENCQKCSGKVSIRQILNSWRKLAKDKVLFPKYKNLNMSFYRLAWSDPRYCQWIVDKSNTRVDIKEKISRLM
jgi:hypothetical protein